MTMCGKANLLTRCVSALLRFPAHRIQHLFAITTEHAPQTGKLLVQLGVAAIDQKGTAIQGGEFGFGGDHQQVVEANGADDAG